MILREPPLLCLTTIERPFRFTLRTLTTINTRRSTRERIKSGIRAAFLATSLTQTSVRGRSHSAALTVNMTQHDNGVLFFYCQLRRWHIRYCGALRRRHKVDERQVLDGNAVRSSYASISRNFPKRIVVDWTAEALRMLRACLVGSKPSSPA